MRSYSTIYKELVDFVEQKNTNDTSTLTSVVKEYFVHSYPNYYVAGAEGNPEFLFDISVLSCDPGLITNNEENEYTMALAAESELGGTSASASQSVENNVFDDFAKLLYANAPQKIMVSSYSVPVRPPSTKEAELARLKRKYIEINNKSNNDTDILVLVLRGDHQSGSSRQIKIVYPLEINGFIIGKNKELINC